MSAFRVIIVGCGLGGLMLANCLQHARIDYLLLEGRDKIGLHVGAAVGVEAHGARILDQLGVLSSLQDVIEPYRAFIFRDAYGKFQWLTDFPELIEARTGYSAFVYDRSFILQALYDHLWDQEKVLLNMRVHRLEHSPDCVTVMCTDGSEHVGQLVVGSDGVNSAVREEMWRLSNVDDPDRIPEKERNFLTANYRGLYGISSAVPGIDAGNMTFVSSKDQVCYWACSKAGKINWCLVEKLDRQYRPPQVPKYTDEDAHAYAMDRLDKQLVSDTADVKFGDFWERKQAWALVALEEGHLDRWSWGRIICSGDSVHKFTPESGQGANQAIESAAALANHIDRLLCHCSDKSPDIAAVRTCLTAFEAKRQRRSKLVVEKTNQHVRLFTHSNVLFVFLTKYVQRIFRDIGANISSHRHIGAERVDFLPIPPRSVSGIVSFNPTQGIGLAESSAKRALPALPLLTMGFLCSCQTKQSLVNMMVQSGHGRISSAEDGSDSSSMDSGTLVDSHQVAWFFVDVAPMYLIWVMEANRRANYLKPIQLTLIFGLLAQTNSLDLWANLWFFLHYIQSPIENFAAADQRLLNMGYARALLPTVLLSYAVPVLAMLFSPGRTVADHLRPVQQFFPVLLSIVHNLFARATQDTTKLDRIYNVTADLSSLRRAGLVAGIVSAATLQYLRYQNSTFGWLSNPISARTPHPPALSALSAGIAHRVHVAPYAGAAVWVAILFKDLKTAGMVKTSWMWLLLYAAISTTIIGPGATLIAAWAWREEVLASKRHWAAVIKAG